MTTWPRNKTSENRVIKIVLYDCTYHIFKRIIAEEVKSKATYLLYGLSTCGKVINNTQLEINDKNEQTKKIIQIKPEKNTHNKIEN